MRNRVEAIILLVVAAAAPLVGQQNVTSAPPPTAEENTAHALRHLDQLSKLSALAAPDSDTKKLLDQQLLPAFRSNLGNIQGSPDIAFDVRATAKNISQAKHVDAISGLLGKDSSFDLLSKSGAIGAVMIPTSDLQIQQVLTNKLPAMPMLNVAANPATTTLSCAPPGTFYPRVIQKFAADASAIQMMANSVGRIERKVADQDPILDGTAFVVDQAHGIIATACHVADDIADFDKAANTWTFPSKAFSPSTKILIDFGTTDQHDPAVEYEVEGIAFVPTLNGCDGALLRVDTSKKPLPPALPLATSELPNPLPNIVDVFSIGYPSRNLSGQTPETLSYFSCIRAASPSAAKFSFGGEVTQDEPENGYHILAHIIPTVQGQSGSPVMLLTDPGGQPQVVGIHICCGLNAHINGRIDCENRNEPFLQEAVSVVDLMAMYRASNAPKQ